MRRLNLHASALTDAEYDLYTASLHDLAEESPPPPSHDDTVDDTDAYYDRLSVGVREARAWLRGRYAGVAVGDIDAVLRYFHADLGAGDTLSGGQFFAALRLVVHAEAGKGVDRGLAFVQAHPDASQAPSPSKPSPPPAPPRQQLQAPSKPPPPAPSQDRNPFARRSAESHPPAQDPSTPSVPVAAAITLVPVSSSSPQKVTHNPFLLRDNKDKPAPPTPSSNPTPPLPPRKPPSLVPPPRHASLLNHPQPHPQPQPQPQPISPSPYAIFTPAPGHITSPLMRQSLQASKAAKTMKKAEAQLDRERVLRVLKKASAPSPNPTKRGTNGAGAAEHGHEHEHEYEQGEGEQGDVDPTRPPLPARRKRNASRSHSPATTSSSRRSLDQVASAALPHHPPPHPLPQQQQQLQQHRHSHFGALVHDEPTTNDSSDSDSSSAPPGGTQRVERWGREREPGRGRAGSPSSTSPSAFPLQAPPTHPDRRPSTPQKAYSLPSPTSPPAINSTTITTPLPSAINSTTIQSTTINSPATGAGAGTGTGTSAALPSPRPLRSHSVHHHPSTPPPVPPPPRRKRPESIQLTTALGVDPSHAPSQHPQPFPTTGTGAGAGGAGLSRHLSLSSQPRHGSPNRRDSFSSTRTLPNPSTAHPPIAHALPSSHFPHAHPLAAPATPIASLQRTLSALQPRLDAARYKAEAGLSRRGYVRGGEEGLVSRRRAGAVGEDEEDGGGVGVDGDVDTDGDDVPPRGDGDGSESDRGARDSLKWPAGEGWKPL